MEFRLFSHLEPCQHDQSMLVSKCLKYYELENFMFQLPEGNNAAMASNLIITYLIYIQIARSPLTVQDFFYQFFIS